MLSEVPVRVLATRVWLGTLLFSGILAVPALFLTHGTTIFRVTKRNIIAWYYEQRFVAPRVMDVSPHAVMVKIWRKFRPSEQPELALVA